MKREGILQILIVLMVISQSSLASIVSSNPPTEICDNGLDDDNDGLIDCYDPDCCSSPACDNTYFDPCALSCLNTASPQALSLQLEWTSSTNNWHPYNTPIVGDLDGDGVNEIVGNRGTWQGIVDYKNLVVINGETGALEKVINTPWFRHTGKELCIADVDQNGLADIFFQVGSSSFNAPNLVNRMVCYEFDGTDYQEKWRSDSTAVGIIPSLADFNYDQIPELYTGAFIFNSQSGKLLVKGNFEQSYGLGFSVAADVLPDNYCGYCDGLELVVGNEVYAVHIDPTNPANNALYLVNQVFGDFIFDGYTSLSDMDGDGDLDAIVSSPDSQLKSTTYIWDIQQAEVMASYTFNANTSGWASLPCIRDIDGDQIPEIAISSNGTLRMLQFTGNSLTELWQIETEDWSSRSGNTIFDLNGDGHFEILHRDQVNFRILDAKTGEQLFIDECISTNLYEHPVIVDVDQDGEAEILCSCENELRAYGAAGKPWVSTRSIWNQYNYYYSNINDDLTVPFQQQNTSLPSSSINSFLNQHSNASSFSIVEATLPPRIDIERGQNTQLRPTIISSSGPLGFMWSPAIDLSCTTCEFPIASPNVNQQYTLLVEAPNGCTDTANVFLSVMECGMNSFGIPNAFTPDADGINDYFEIIFNTNLPIEGDISVFNRWGQRVFFSDNLYARWNGRYRGQLAVSDTYIFIINYRCANGIKQTRKGGLTLIR